MMSAITCQKGTSMELTLSVQEVADWNEVVALLVVDGGVLEDLAGVSLWANAHVLLAEVLDLSVDIGILLQNGKLASMKLELIVEHR